MARAPSSPDSDREDASGASPALTFYPAEVDGAPAAFVVDLEQEPNEDMATRIVVAMSMKDPTEEGLRSEAELEALDDAQTAIGERIETAFDATHVGFYDLNGATTLIFYARESATAETVAEAIGDLGYALDVHVADDPEWRFYIDVLFPDAYALQGIWNRAIIDELEAQGDALEEPREVDHLVTFPSEEAAHTAAKALAAAHFHIDEVFPDEDEEGRFALAFHRSETLEGDKPHRLSAEVLDIVLPLDGEYDGWDAPAASREQAEEEEPSESGTKKHGAAPKATAAASAKNGPEKKRDPERRKKDPERTRALVKKPDAKKPAVKKPAVKKPAVKKPAAKKPAVKRPAAAKKKAVKRPAAAKKKEGREETGREETGRRKEADAKKTSVVKKR